MPTDQGGGAGYSPGPARRALKRQDALWDELLQLAVAVESALQTSMTALSEGRPDLLTEVKEQEHAINRWEVRIEQECLGILALFDPTASDLRRMVGVLKIDRELERMADLAVHVAKGTKKLAQAPDPITIPEPIIALSQLVMAALRTSLEALKHLDAESAHSVILHNGAIARDSRAVHKELKQIIRREPERTEAWLRLISIVRNLERLADHAAHIAEIVVYIKSGLIIRHSEGQPPSP